MHGTRTLRPRTYIFAINRFPGTCVFSGSRAAEPVIPNDRGLLKAVAARERVETVIFAQGSVGLVRQSGWRQVPKGECVDDCGCVFRVDIRMCKTQIPDVNLRAHDHMLPRSSPKRLGTASRPFVGI